MDYKIYILCKTHVDILKLIEKGVRTPFEISKIIKRAYSTTYEGLMKLEKNNLVTAEYGMTYETGKRARIYTITKKGKGLLKNLKKHIYESTYKI